MIILTYADSVMEWKQLHCRMNVLLEIHYLPMSAKIDIWPDICQISNDWLCNIWEKEHWESGNETGIECGLGMRIVLNVVWEWDQCWTWFGNEIGADLMCLKHLPLVEDLEGIDLLRPLHLHHLGWARWNGWTEMSSPLNTHKPSLTSKKCRCVG